MNEKHHCAPENAKKFLDWIKTRGGIAVWKSINLSNPTGSWSSPATIKRRDCTNYRIVEGLDGNEIIPYPKPNWQCANEPVRVITDPADVLVDVPKEWKRFHINLRGKGMSLVLTDASSRKVRQALSKCHSETGKACWHEFEEQTCVINYADKEIPLLEFLNHESQTGNKT